jgi:hypothetical protein
MALVPVQVQNVVATDSSFPDESWRRCRADVRSCNSSQIQVLNGIGLQSLSLFFCFPLSLSHLVWWCLFLSRDL